MEMRIGTFAALLLVAAVVAMVARRLKVPYTVGLVIAGVALALFSIVPQIRLTKELIFTLFLPPLVFEAALYIGWQELKRDLPVIVTLASLGMMLSALVTAAGMHYVIGWQWSGALVFGTLIAATDPVSVIANFKEAGVHGRLRLLVEAESLFNDSTAAIAFVVTLAIAGGHSIGFTETLGSLALNISGGIFVGLVVAGFLLLLAGRTTDRLVELTLTTVAAYSSFLLAEHFNCSGILSSMTAGLLIGNVGVNGVISESSKEAVISFWDFAAFVANSLIFLLIGIREAQQSLAGMWGAVTVGIAFVLLGRAVAIYPLCTLFSRSNQRVDMKHQHIMVWGGLRGALALALALGLPPDIPHSAEIVTVAFAVVAFSVIVQGLTMTPLLRAFGEIR